MPCKSIKQGRALLRVSFVFVCLTSTEENHHLENQEKLFTLFYVVSIPAHDYFVVRRKAFLTSTFLYFSLFFVVHYFFCFFTLKIKQFRLRNSFQKKKTNKRVLASAERFYEGISWHTTRPFLFIDVQTSPPPLFFLNS